MDIQPANLFGHLYNLHDHSWGWALLAFDERNANVEPALRQVCATVTSWDWVRPWLILGAAVAGDGDVMVLSDLDIEEHTAYNISYDAVMVLARLDGHIAYCDRADRLDLIDVFSS